MAAPAKTPVTRPSREIVGLFHSAQALEKAVQELASAGWDRAEMSLLGGRELATHHGAGKQDSEQMADDPATDRGLVVSKDDVRQVRTLTAGLAGVVGAFLTAGATIMSGGAALAAIIGAAAVGGGAAAAVEAVGNRENDERNAYLRQQLARGGILLWALLREPQDEAKARDILQRNGADDIHVHEANAPPTERMTPR